MLDPDPKKTITVDALMPDHVEDFEKLVEDMPASDFHEEANVDIYYHDEENVQDTHLWQEGDGSKDVGWDANGSPSVAYDEDSIKDTQEGNADTSGDSIDV